MSARARWIGIVVGLLAGNAVAVAILLGAAGGDTRRRVLPDYYQRAAAWDATMAAAARSARLRWSCTANARGREVAVVCRDATGGPLDRADVSVRVAPRGHADEPAAIHLTATGGGVHHALIPGQRPGLHDLAISVARDGERWTGEQVVDVGPGAAP